MDIPARMDKEHCITQTNLKSRLEAAIALANSAGEKPIVTPTVLMELSERLGNLERGEREWQDAFDAVQDPVFLHDKDCRIIRANRAYARQAGMNIQDVIGKYYWEVFPEGDGPLSQSAGLQEKGNSATQSQEVTLPGGEIYMSRGFAVRDQCGDYLYSVHIMENISEQRHLQSALEESNSRYYSLFESAPDAIFLADAETGQLLDANPAAERLTGRSREEILSLHQSQLHPVNSQAVEDFMSHVQAGLAGGTHPSSEVEVLHVDGHKITTEITARVFKLNGRQVIQGIFRDISSRKLIESKLRHNAQVLAQIHDSVVTTDLDGFISSWNHGAECLFGYTEAEALGKSIAFVYPEENRPFFMEKIVAPLKANGSHKVEVSMCRKSGEVFIAQLSLSLLRDEQGNSVGMIGYALDITERKLTEKLLHDSEAGLAEAQRIAKIGNWELDIVKNILTWSNEMARILEFEPQHPKLSYEAFLAIIHPDDREEVDHVYQESVKTKSPFNIVHRILMPDGKVKFVREMCETHYDEYGRAIRSMGTLQDITEQYLTSQALSHSNHALKALISCNSVLIHATTEQEMLNNMCRVIIDEGGYRLAWIGVVDDDEMKSVRPVAHAGVGSDYLEKINITYADNKFGHGPSGYAVRQGYIQVVQDTFNDPRFRPWREAAAERHFRSALSLPLKESKGRVFAVLNIYAKEPNSFDNEAQQLMQRLADDLAFGILSLRTRDERDHYFEEHQKSDERHRQMLVAAIRAMSLMVEKRDPYTAGHQNKVAQLCVAIGKELGMGEDRLEGLRLGAMIHDIGKIYVPAEILNRPGRLTKAEFEIIKSHAEVGYDIIKDVQFPWPVANMVIQHHERMDGSGYPRGLKGDEIILEARILAVADVAEAITSHRPYRAAKGMDKAIEEIEANRYTLYDDAIAEICLRLIRGQGFTFEDDNKT